MSEPNDDPVYRPRVVVGDDSDIHRVAMTAMLERAGFDVVVARDGAEAVELVFDRRPDALVVDALMPVMSGFEAIEQVRRHPAFDTLPTIVVSGLEDVESRVRALSIGADDFVTKPVHADELVARLRSQLRNFAAWTARSPDHEAERRLDRWLEEIIDGAAFDVHFQPVVDMVTGRIEAQEALVRFHDGTSPADVFNTAARVDRTVPLELAIVSAAVEHAAHIPTDVAIHVNVSPLAALSEQLPDLLAPTGHRFVLEITENDRFGPAEAAVLRSRLPGCRIAADDVGAGFAGLTQLVRVRPDIVKIDRAIVTDIHDDPARQVVVAGLVRFAETTGASLIAEGIERGAEADSLIELGVRLGQGFYFGRPSPLFADGVSA